MASTKSVNHNPKHMKKEPNQPPARKRRKIVVEDEANLSIVNSINSSYTDADFNDVEFIIGVDDDTQSFAANKFMFAMQSKWFKTLFYAESVDSSNEPIRISDITPAAFDYLHQLFYLKAPKLSSEIIVDVLFAANKCMLDGVIEECKQRLKGFNKIDDIYTVLFSMDSYAETVLFDQALDELTKNAPLKMQLQRFIDDERFKELSSRIIVSMIQSQLFSSEYNKYVTVRNYCVAVSRNDKGLGPWKAMLEKEFMRYIKFGKIDCPQLVSTIRNDGILSADYLFDIVDYQLNISGFRLSEVLLNFCERRGLKVGDMVDIRDDSGRWYEERVIGSVINRIKVGPVGSLEKQTIVGPCDNQWVAKHKSVTGKRRISRPCLKNIKKGDEILINYGKHPNYKCEDKWDKCKLQQIQKSSAKAIAFVFSPHSDGQRNYCVHPDSLDECRCINVSCEFCEIK